MLKLLLALLFACVACPSQALMLSSQMGLHEAASLSGELSALADAGGQLRVDDVAAPGKAADFAPLPEWLRAGYTRDAYWVRFTLQRTQQTPGDWLVEVSPAFLNDVTLFVPRSDGHFEVTQLGDLRAWAQRPLPHRNFVVPLHLPDDRPRTYYLRVKTSSAMVVRVQAWQYAGLMTEVQADTALYGVYFGILALAFISNLLFWVWLRERMYLRYCAYLAALAMMALTVGGFASQWFFAQQPLLASRAVGVSVALAYLFGTHFFVSVLHLREHFPRIRRGIAALLLFYGLCALAAAAGLWVIAPWLMWIALITNIGLNIAGPWLVWRGHREYLLYILAFIVNFAAVPLSVTQLMGWLTLPISIESVTILGSIIHIVVLSFAVVDRMRQTERKMRAAVKLTAELSAERDAVRQQRQFVSMVSHEFRTPLAVIDATAQSVEIACSQSNSVSYEFIAPRQEKIRRAVRRMVSLLENLLTDERLEFHENKYDSTLVDLRAMASMAARAWEHLLRTPEQMELVLGPDPVRVFVDPSLTTLALSNLIDNAIKYSPAGGRIRLRVGKNKDHGWIEVHDGGVGIAAKDIAQIFDKFYRSGEAHDVPGAGLGLYLVRTVIRDQGGNIEVESEPGHGSCFLLNIPLAK